MRLKSVLVIAAAAAMLPVGSAKAQFSESYNFLKAVRDADGAKVTSILAKPGTIIVDTRDGSTGETALHIVTKRRDLTWLNFMLGKGARPDVRDAQGNTPLMLAAQLGWTDGASVLIERRAQVDLAGNSGQTPLIRAVQNRDLAMVKLLLMAGANPSRPEIGSGLSARDYAVRDLRSAAIVKAIDEAKPRPKASVGPN